MQTTLLSGVRMLRGTAPREERRSRWKLRLFTWPLRRQSLIRINLTSGGSVPCDRGAIWLLQERELQDRLLAAARRRFETLNADPGTDELTLVMAHHEIFRRKREIAAAFTSERAQPR